MVIYINEKYLKDKTNLTNNIDVTLLLPSIIKAQDIYITPFLGYELDAELKDVIATTSGTVIQNNLISLIRKAAAEYTAYASYSDILTRAQNKTISIGSIENGASISLDDLDKLKIKTLGYAKFYLKEVGKFLKDNSNSFPTWKQKNVLSRSIIFDEYFNCEWCNCYGCYGECKNRYM